MASILVVDDDTEIREALTELLADEGYQVQAAANGAEAMERLREKPVCLILLDLMMPVMNGWQFRAEQVKDPKLAPIPVVVLSAADALAEKAAALGVTGFMKKPCHLDTLLETVARYC